MSEFSLAADFGWFVTGFMLIQKLWYAAGSSSFQFKALAAAGAAAAAAAAATTAAAAAAVIRASKQTIRK